MRTARQIFLGQSFPHGKLCRPEGHVFQPLFVIPGFPFLNGLLLRMAQVNAAGDQKRQQEHRYQSFREIVGNRI